jgi:hypothetical protein
MAGGSEMTTIVEHDVKTIWEFNVAIGPTTSGWTNIRVDITKVTSMSKVCDEWAWLDGVQYRVNAPYVEHWNTAVTHVGTRYA